MKQKNASATAHSHLKIYMYTYCSLFKIHMLFYSQLKAFLQVLELRFPLFFKYNIKSNSSTASELTVISFHQLNLTASVCKEQI